MNYYEIDEVFIQLFEVVSFFNRGITFLGIRLKINHKEDFTDAMFEWLEENGYTTKDINQIISNEDEDEITLIMDDGTYVTLKKGFLGWDVVDEGKIEEESDIDDTKKRKEQYTRWRTTK